LAEAEVRVETEWGERRDDHRRDSHCGVVYANLSVVQTNGKKIRKREARTRHANVLTYTNWKKKTHARRGYRCIVQRKKLIGQHVEGKREQSFQTLIFRSWSCHLYQTHLFISKVRAQLHGGAANWWSNSSRVGLAEPEPSQTHPKSFQNARASWQQILTYIFIICCVFCGNETFVYSFPFLKKK
jgi:hypothetical protein